MLFLDIAGSSGQYTDEVKNTKNCKIENINC